MGRKTSCRRQREGWMGYGGTKGWRQMMGGEVNRGVGITANSKHHFIHKYSSSFLFKINK